MLPSPVNFTALFIRFIITCTRRFTVRLYDTFGRPAVIADTDAGLFIPQPERIFEFDKQAVHIYRGVVGLHRSGFDLRKVEHIADKLQQECVVVFNDVDIFLFLFRNPPFPPTPAARKSRQWR